MFHRMSTVYTEVYTAKLHFDYGCTCRIGILKIKENSNSLYSKLINVGPVEESIGVTEDLFKIGSTF